MTEPLTIEMIYPYQEGHPSCPIPGKTWDSKLDLHDHRFTEHGSYGTWTRCMMHPRAGNTCDRLNQCEDCKRGKTFKKLGLNGVDYGKK